MKIIECPRDALQGIKKMIPAEEKARYLNQLLRAGFDTIDFGSFVSPKAVPQMADTASVLKLLDLGGTRSKLLAVVANLRGAAEACSYQEITCIGYPFSISETFQLRNTGATISESLEEVNRIRELCAKNNKELVIYISMAFGNPFGDEWNIELALSWISQLSKLDIGVFSLSDTVGVAKPSSVSYIMGSVVTAYPEIEFGAHLHTTAHNWRHKAVAAWDAGCRRFDGAILGYGGCPFAGDELIGNMPTENLLMLQGEKQGKQFLHPDTVKQLEVSFRNLFLQ